MYMTRSGMVRQWRSRWKEETVFPTMVTSMVEIGEETGELPDMLTRIADNYDEDVDNAVAGMTSLIEPVMIVFLAVAVGFIVIALFLPIVAIIETIGKINRLILILESYSVAKFLACSRLVLSQADITFCTAFFRVFGIGYRECPSCSSFWVPG